MINYFLSKAMHRNHTRYIGHVCTTVILQVLLVLFNCLSTNAQVTDTVLQQISKSFTDKAFELKPVVITEQQMLAHNDFDQGYKLNSEGKYQEALEFLKRAIDTDTTGNCGSGENGTAYNELGFAYSRLKQYSEAHQYLNRAIAINPRYPKPYLNKMVLYQTKKENQAAVEIIEQLIAQVPDFAAAYIQLGNLYEQLDNSNGALQAYRKWLSLMNSTEKNENQVKLEDGIKQKIARLEASEMK
jgi:tetratricopeptide (TPR) repeat protein